MDPLILRGGFRIGFFILAAALVSLPFQAAGSAEFVVTLLAAVAAALFLGGIAVLARAAEGHLPNDSDRRSGYNGRSTTRGR